MTPAARIALAVELLERIEAGTGAADRQVAQFFRSRRFAGAKDRAAVSGLAYAVLRRRGELVWRLESCRAAARPRNLVLAALAVVEGRTPAEISGLFDGGRFAPPSLSAAEVALLACLDRSADAPMPDWAASNVPAWLEPEFRRRFGANLLAEMQALQARAPVDLRVNTLKGSREEARAALAAIGVEAAPTRLSPVGLRLAGRPALEREAVFQSGLVEPQDEGSQLVALVAGAAPGLQVVDLCAGAGGKTLAMAAAMGNRGQIYACDADRVRLGRLAPRLQRAGVRNVQVHPLAGADDPWLADLAGRADRVLLDVPCSGTGAWRRQPEARWRLTPEILAGHRAVQWRLLEQGAALVRPGGRLVYATCSLLPAENEDQVAAFLDRHPAFTLLPASAAWQEAIAAPWPDPGSDVLRLSPAHDDVDGFFAAVLLRNA